MKFTKIKYCIKLINYKKNFFFSKEKTKKYVKIRVINLITWYEIYENIHTFPSNLMNSIQNTIF